MINTTIQYDFYIIIIIIVASVPTSTRPDPRGRGQDPRGRGQDPRDQDRGQGRVRKILAFGIRKISKAIKKIFMKI